MRSLSLLWPVKTESRVCVFFFICLHTLSRHHLCLHHPSTTTAKVGASGGFILDLNLGFNELARNRILLTVLIPSPRRILQPCHHHHRRPLTIKDLHQELLLPHTIHRATTPSRRPQLAVSPAITLCRLSDHLLALHPQWTIQREIVGANPAPAPVQLLRPETTS